MSDTIVEVDGSVGVMKIDRPEKLNAFTPSVLESLRDALVSFEENDDVRAVLFTATGDDAFCAGVDLGGGSDGLGSTAETVDTVHRAQRLLKRLRRTPLPVVGGVTGYAMGAGMDLALGCDIRVVRAEAALSQAYVNVGLVPGDGGAYLLPRLVGEETAKDLIFSGRKISGEEAFDLGLASAVVQGDADETREEAMAKAREYASGPTIALGKAKRLVNEAHDVNLDTALSHAIEEIANCRQTYDHEEAVVAFTEDREPMFTGQ